MCPFFDQLSRAKSNIVWMPIVKSKSWSNLSSWLWKIGVPNLIKLKINCLIYLSWNRWHSQNWRLVVLSKRLVDARDESVNEKKKQIKLGSPLFLQRLWLKLQKVNIHKIYKVLFIWLQSSSNARLQNSKLNTVKSQVLIPFVRCT